MSPRDSRGQGFLASDTAISHDQQTIQLWGQCLHVVPSAAPSFLDMVATCPRERRFRCSRVNSHQGAGVRCSIGGQNHSWSRITGLDYISVYSVQSHLDSLQYTTPAKCCGNESPGMGISSTRARCSQKERRHDGENRHAHPGRDSFAGWVTRQLRRAGRGCMCIFRCAAAPDKQVPLFKRGWSYHNFRRSPTGRAIERALISSCGEGHMHDYYFEAAACTFMARGPPDCA
jgi:hypothetical protein